MYIFIDESGTTNAKGKQGFLVIAFALTSNYDFPEGLIFKIKDRCRDRGRPIKNKELKYHELTQFQKEIAVSIINAEYRDFYLCFFDLEHANEQMVTGEHEQTIQARSIDIVLSKLNKADMRKNKSIKVVMDKKLSKTEQKAIQNKFKGGLEMKKGVSVETVSSSSDRGVQLADLIAGAFRAKKMKKSDLFKVDNNRIFEIKASDISHFTADRA